MSRKLFCAVVSLAATLSGCLQPQKGEYSLSPAEAMARLERADIIGFRNGRQCGYLIHFNAIHPDPQTIQWTVTSNGAAVASFKVSLSPTARGVKADIDVPKAPDGGEIYDGKQAYDYPVFMQPLRPALEELVDAAMEQRALDWRRLPGRTNIGPDETLSICVIGRANLDGGVPWLMTDPPGLLPQIAARRRRLKH